MKQAFFLTWIFILCLTAAFLGGYLTHRWQTGGLSQFPLLQDAYQILRGHGLKDIPSSPPLEYGMIRGMLQSYDDPYTVFVEPAQAELQSNELQGSFGGIGVQLEKNSEGDLILHPIADSPAARAGVLDGDRLTRVDALAVDRQTSLETVQAAVRGEIGSQVKIAVARPPDGQSLEFTLERASIALPSATWFIDGDEPRLGIIAIHVIAASTPEEIQKAVGELQSRGAQRFLLDLRDNRGGLLDAGVDAARLFLRNGLVIQQQYRGRPVEDFAVRQPGVFADLPVAVLVNQGTASAAEILAGALKAHGRAKVIGAPSFGKDSLQLVFALRDQSSLHVTAARWWVPGLNPPISEGGIQPDILVEADPGQPKAEIQAAIQALFTEN